jgi:hypothetical protein
MRAAGGQKRRAGRSGIFENPYFHIVEIHFIFLLDKSRNGV